MCVCVYLYTYSLPGSFIAELEYQRGELNVLSSNYNYRKFTNAVT